MPIHWHSDEPVLRVRRREKERRRDRRGPLGHKVLLALLPPAEEMQEVRASEQTSWDRVEALEENGLQRRQPGRQRTVGDP